MDSAAWLMVKDSTLEMSKHYKILKDLNLKFYFANIYAIAVDSKSFEVIFVPSKFKIALSKTFFEVKTMVL